MSGKDSFKGGVTRRELLRGGAAAIAVFGPLGCGNSERIGVLVGGSDGQAGEFLTEPEMQTLRALVDTFIPPDSDPGASAAGCADAIDGLLSAFSTEVPRIYAGGPFSDRGGAPVNDFENFVPLDAYETRAWKLRIEGSRGDPALEFNGPVKGLQEIYRAGLAALEAAGFSAMSAPQRELALRTSQDAAVQALVDLAFPHTLEFMYGAPEYGGNKDLVAWDYTNFDGDTQPRGYTREQVENPDNPGIFDPPGKSLPAAVSVAALHALMPMAAPEMLHGLLARSGGSLRKMQAEIARVLGAAEKRPHPTARAASGSPISRDAGEGQWPASGREESPHGA